MTPIIKSADDPDPLATIRAKRLERYPGRSVGTPMRLFIGHLRKRDARRLLNYWRALGAKLQLAPDRHYRRLWALYR